MKSLVLQTSIGCGVELMSSAVRFFLGTFLIIWGSCSTGAAQITVVRNGVDVREEKISLLLAVACDVVAEEFRLSRPSDALFPVTLVLGDPNERVIGDELHQVYFIYMNRWNEAQFATSASRLAMQHMVSQERKTKMVAEILRRANRVGPVSVEELHELKRSRKAFR